MNSIDIMLDLETTGKRAGCPILSIGACDFNSIRRFEANISHISCLDVGLKDQYETMNWWDKQSEEAKNVAFSGKEPLVEALGRFSDWLRSLNTSKDKVFVWGNGAKFDLGILEAAYVACDMVYPIDYQNERCYRTLKNLYYSIKAGEFIGTKHNALHDALHQAKHAKEILERHFAPKQD